MPENLRSLMQNTLVLTTNVSLVNEIHEEDGVKGEEKRKPRNNQQPINASHLQASLKVPASSATSFARYAPSIAHRLVHIAVNIGSINELFLCVLVDPFLDLPRALLSCRQAAGLDIPRRSSLPCRLQSHVHARLWRCRSLPRSQCIYTSLLCLCPSYEGIARRPSSPHHTDLRL